MVFSEKTFQHIGKEMNITDSGQKYLIKLAAVAADASLGLQICGPKPDSIYNGNVHECNVNVHKMEGVNGVCYNSI